MRTNASTPAAPLPDGLWTVKDVAAYCQVSSYTVREWVKQEIIPAHPIGRLIRFVPEEVRAAVTRRTGSGGTQS